MDQADSELRETIRHIWPLQAKKLIDLLVPRNDELNAGKLTVGKIYAGLLILESWKNTRFGQLESELPVRIIINNFTQNLLKLKQRTEFFPLVEQLNNNLCYKSFHILVYINIDKFLNNFIPADANMFYRMSASL